MDFEGRIVLLTGGLGGIGRDITKLLVSLGAKVIVTDRNKPGDAGMSAIGPGTTFLPLDVTSETEWKAVLQTTVDRHGKLDALVNIAGVFKPGIPFEEMTLAQWRYHMDVNLDGSFIGCSLGMKYMAATGGGSIVNFSSGLAEIMLSDGGAYCVSKAAVLALTRLAAKAGGKFKVRVNAVLPGAIDTPMLWGNLREGQKPQVLLDMLVKQHPIGRIGTTRDVAHAVAFLSHPDSSFITGAMLAVDGGQLVD